MWPLRFNKIIVFFLFLSSSLIISAVLPAALPHSFAAEKPTIEPAVLRKIAVQHFNEGEFIDAAIEFQRLCDLFPSSPDHLDNLEKLGDSYVKTKNLPKAIEAYRERISFDSGSIASLNTRLKLGDTYLQSSLFSESSLTANEILRSKRLAQAGRKIEIEANALHAKSLLGLKKFPEAKTAIDQAFLLLTPSRSAPAHLVQSRLTIDFALCARLASDKGLTEEQIIDQIERRGTCLFESSIRAKSILKDKITWDLIRSAYEIYADTCAQPPVPEGKRSEVELEKFRKELAHKLIPECANRISKIADALKTLHKKEIMTLEETTSGKLK